MKKLYQFLILCLFYISIVVPTAGGTTLYHGSVTDALGDDLFGSIFDFISGSATVTDTDLIFTTTFAPGKFNWEKARIGVLIDIDQDPATGFPGIDAAGTDSSIFGTDYLIAWGGSSISLSYGITKFDSGFTNLGSGFSTTHSVDNSSVIIPLSIFGGTTFSEFNFVFTIQEVLSATESTGIYDYMPDNGSFGSTAPIPEPTTMLLFGIGLLGLTGMSRRKR